jgi:predicted acylesterase/phospholipase RssA
MAGALYEFEELGVEYSLVATTGAGMFIGLVYAGPPGTGDVKTLRQEALKNVVDMFLDERMYTFMDMLGFPANYKVFHKTGPLATVYTEWWEKNRNLIPTPPFLGKDDQRLYSDWVDMVLATFCPTDLSLKSKAMCQHAPFIREAVDFNKIHDASNPDYFPGNITMGAYCLDTEEIELFKKEEMTEEMGPKLFQAALSLPMVYAPVTLPNGKTYIEGAAIDPIGFEPVLDQYFVPDAGAGTVTLSDGQTVASSYVPNPDMPTIDTLLVFNIMGHRQLLREPRNLYDSISQEIMTPLVALSNETVRLFKLEHLPRYKQGHPDLELLEVQLRPEDLTKEEWGQALEWSRSNATRLFEKGREKAREVFAANEERLAPKSKKPAKKSRKAA